MEWQEELNKKRVKTKGWYGCIAPDGWKNIVEEADKMLATLDPDYEVHQIKEKFGTLRYYYEGGKDETTRKIMDAIISYAELLSGRVCEVCGNSSWTARSDWGNEFDNSATLKVTEGGFYKTICDSCDPEGRFLGVQKAGAKEQYQDLEFYAKEARAKLSEGQDILDLFLAIAKEDLGV